MKKEKIMLVAYCVPSKQYVYGHTNFSKTRLNYEYDISMK